MSEEAMTETLEKDMDLEDALGTEGGNLAFEGKSRASGSPPSSAGAPVYSGSLPVAAAAAAAASVGGLAGIKKAAVFILSLDEDVASLLLRCLSDVELERITTEIAGLGVVDKDTVSQVIREFRELEQIQSMVREGGLEHAIRLVERSFPRDKATRIVQLLASHRQHLPFSFLEGIEAETLFACLGEEHPQTLAVILAHMSPAKAAELLEKLPAPARRDVLERIAGLEGTNTEALRSLELSLRKHLDAARFESLGEAGGVKAAAEILRAAGGGGTSFLDDLREGQPELAEEISRHLFVFEDLVALDDRALQAVLKEIDTRRLALALKNAAEDVKAKVFNNLSRRAVEMVREEMDLRSPVRFVEVEAARRAILETVLRLEAAGQVYISGRGREENRIVY